MTIGLSLYELFVLLSWIICIFKELLTKINEFLIKTIKLELDLLFFMSSNPLIKITYDRKKNSVKELGNDTR